MSEIQPAQQSHVFRNIMIIIIIALLIWQYLLPVFMTVDRPSDYIFNANLDKTFTVYLIDEVTGLKTPMIKPTTPITYWSKLVYAHTYHLNIVSDIRPNILASFRVLMDMRYQDKNGTLVPPSSATDPFYRFGSNIPGYAPLIQTSFPVSQGNFEINYEYQLMRIDFSMYNQEGIKLKYASTLETSIIIYLQGSSVPITPGVIYN